MADVRLNIEFNATRLLAALSELELYIDSLSADFRERLIQFLLDGNNFRPGIMRHETRAADGTQIVFLEPGQRLLDLLAACRTGNLKDILIKADCHPKTSKD